MTKKKSSKKPATLSIDIGGSGTKAAVLNERGKMITERVRMKTPDQATPAAVIRTIMKITKDFPQFTRISVGFPGVVREGRIMTAPNLGSKAWHRFDMAKALKKKFRVPVRVTNDAEVQGLAVIRGKGLEFVMTLGTGVGTSLFWNGNLTPHLELAHHPIHDGLTYDQYLGDDARKEKGNKKWSRRVRKAVDTLTVLLNYDHIYIGGGNGRRLDFPLDRNMSIISNQAGILGGHKLWKLESIP